MHLPTWRVELQDENYVMDPADGVVAVMTISIARTITLPDPTVCGYQMGPIISDESGLLSALLSLTISAPAGFLVNGGASVAIVAAFGQVRLYSSGKAWFSR